MDDKLLITLLEAILEDLENGFSGSAKEELKRLINDLSNY
jgi:hypothetical protein